MIVLVTGSRYATAEEHGKVIRHALIWSAGARDGAFGDHELWDGAAGGIDKICHGMAHEDFGWETESFPAMWSVCSEDFVDPLGKVGSCDPYHRRKRSDGRTEYCPTAGFRRNQLMVDRLTRVEGRKVVVGFPIPALGSRGTLDCLTRALHAGLPVISVPLTTRNALKEG